MFASNSMHLSSKNCILSIRQTHSKGDIAFIWACMCHILLDILELSSKKGPLTIKNLPFSPHPPPIKAVVFGASST